MSEIQLTDFSDLAQASQTQLTDYLNRLKTRFETVMKNTRRVMLDETNSKNGLGEYQEYYKMAQVIAKRMIEVKKLQLSTCE